MRENSGVGGRSEEVEERGEEIRGKGQRGKRQLFEGKDGGGRRESAHALHLEDSS